MACHTMCVCLCELLCWWAEMSKGTHHAGWMSLPEGHGPKLVLPIRLASHEVVNPTLVSCDLPRHFQAYPIQAKAGKLV
jgi:hypothetical protein